METRHLQIQRDFANNKEGRFIPYIGKFYDNGLKIGSKKYRILIIGPRHYCDASHNSRNVLVGLENDKYKLISGQNFPPEFKVGCTKDAAFQCLKSEQGRSCPVYKHKKCPFIDNCGIMHSFHCEGERNLRCETLYAIKEFLYQPEIESARLGISYFGQITQFILSQFRPNLTIKSQIWDRVAFFNLIQRYIPLMSVNFDSKSIAKYIRSEDVKVGETLIRELGPDIIIMTMRCVSNALRTNLNNTGYKIMSMCKSYGYIVYSNESSNIIFNKPIWQKKIDKMTDKYILPTFSYQLRTFAQALQKEILTRFRSEIDGRSAENEVRKYLYSIFFDKINRAGNISPSISRISCFKKSCKNPVEAMRQWMRYKEHD